MDDADLLRGLVGIPSVSRHEAAAVEWLVARMAERGFRASVDQAGNAVGEIGDGPRQVVLLGHIDTVPGAIAVRAEGDEFFGRGAVDAKGPLAAFVAAATAPVPGVRVTVVGAVEEESPTSKGARYRATLPAPDWCVIGEPSGWAGVAVAYKGRLVVRASVERSARHGAAPGPTCVEEALAFWESARAQATLLAPEAGFAASARDFDRSARGFEKLDCRLEAVSSESDGLVERTELRIGYRVPPGLATDAVLAQVSALAAAHGGDARVRVETLAAEEPVRTSRGSALARAFARAIGGAGGQVTFKVKSGTSDMNVLAPAWGCAMVAYGPGDSAYDHTPMERLSLSEYARAIDVLRGVLRQAAEIP